MERPTVLKYMALALVAVVAVLVFWYFDFISLLSGNFRNDMKARNVVKIKSEESCFCQLQGTIDDCTCQIDTETVDHFNNYKVYPRLSSLLSKDYFRYFQVNLKKPCPFWIDDGSCSSEFCQVQACKEEEVPAGLKGQNGKLKPFSAKKYSLGLKGCKDADLGSINLALSEETQAGFERWKVHDQSLVDFCTVKEDEIDADLQYVDLLLNPERYTGYKGPSALRVWDAVYKENCFGTMGTTNSLGPFGAGPGEEECIEKRTFYRAISGIHASINIHLSSKYLLSDSWSIFKKGKPVPKWGPNMTEFLSHFERPEARKTGFPWLKNLYFLYLLELRAVWKLSPFLRNFDLYTGNTEEDDDTKTAIKDLLSVVGAFPSHFEEKALFSTKDALKLRSEFHERFTNITRIMDCVGCQKCKLWGKLQVKGLGTALKILFSEPFNFLRGADFLSRNEIVALFNAFGKLSESIHQLERFRKNIESGGKGG